VGVARGGSCVWWELRVVGAARGGSCVWWELHSPRAWGVANPPTRDLHAICHYLHESHTPATPNRLQTCQLLVLDVENFPAFLLLVPDFKNRLRRVKALRTTDSKLKMERQANNTVGKKQSQMLSDLASKKSK
jgi:hypothetical protein